MTRELGPDQVQLRFTSDPRLLCVARASVRRFVEMAGFDGKQAENLVLAVDESLTNVIRHCYAGRPTEPIELDLELVNGALVVRIRDCGPRIPPERLAPPAEKDLQVPGGLGLRLIHEVMDSVELKCCSAGGNELVLTCRPQP